MSNWRRKNTGRFLDNKLSMHDLKLYTQNLSCSPAERDYHLYRTICPLGSGQFGLVSKGLWYSPAGPKEVAIKVLQDKADKVEKVKFLQEAAIMGQFHHPNVITLHGVVTVGEPVSKTNCFFHLLISHYVNCTYFCLDNDYRRTDGKGRPQRIPTFLQTCVCVALLWACSLFSCW